MGMPKTLKRYVCGKLQNIMSYIELAQCATTQEERDKRLNQAKEQVRQLDELLND
jgi:hypothetical protein